MLHCTDVLCQPLRIDDAVEVELIKEKLFGRQEEGKVLLF